MNTIKKIFLISSPLFVLTHIIALKLYLYWYYWWFDVFMHTWGGILISLSIFSLVNVISFKLSLKHVLIVLFIVTTSWELFEWKLGLWNNDYVIDTTQDIFFGYLGGIVTYFTIKKFYFYNYV